MKKQQHESLIVICLKAVIVNKLEKKCQTIFPFYYIIQKMLIDKDCENWEENEKKISDRLQ